MSGAKCIWQIYYHQCLHKLSITNPIIMMHQPAFVYQHRQRYNQQCCVAMKTYKEVWVTKLYSRLENIGLTSQTLQQRLQMVTMQSLDWPKGNSLFWKAESPNSDEISRLVYKLYLHSETPVFGIWPNTSPKIINTLTSVFGIRPEQFLVYFHYE